MQYTIEGNNSKKVLILHGWMHSAEIYFKLGKDISDRAETTLFEFPGFGDTPKVGKLDIMGYYENLLCEYLKTHKFDLIIAHSMGGTILLRVLCNQEVHEGNVIYLNPEYMGINRMKPIAMLMPLNILLLYIQKIAPLWVVEPIIKMAALLSINSLELIDDILVKGVRKADPITCAILSYQLAFDRWKTHGNTYKGNTSKSLIVMSSEDRVIEHNKLETLSKETNIELMVAEGIGHTPVVENYDLVLEIVTEYLNN